MAEIHSGFWRRMPRPLTVLAPMEEVTDAVFRDVVHRAGRPDVFFSEFLSASSLLRRGREAMRRLEYHSDHRPMVAQIWGNDPGEYYRAVKELHLRGFDGVDINMGCPQKKITSKGSCSALILNPSLASELILAAKEAAADAWRDYGAHHDGPPGRLIQDGPMPVSVKTRIGWNKPVTEDWCRHLLSHDIAVLTVHGRTVAQQSEGQADWNEIAKVSCIRDSLTPETLIIGNGDVIHPAQLAGYPRLYGVDGVMVGRGIFTNPFIFSGREFHELPPTEQIAWALEHLHAYRKRYEGCRNYEIMKKFFKIYLQDFEGADELRADIMETTNYSEAESLLKSALEISDTSHNPDTN